MRLPTFGRAPVDVLRLPAAALVVCLVVLSHSVPAAAQDDPFGVQSQELNQVVQTDVTTPTGSKGVMVRPYGPGPFPAILHLYGSGESVAKSVVLLRAFAHAGYVAMTIEYRQLDGGGTDIQDVYASLDFLKQSRFVRKGLVGLNGFSLGARTALIVAINQDVRAVSAIATRTTGGSPPTILDQADRLKAPILLQHGTEDPSVPYQDSVLLEQKLKSLKRKVQLVTYKGAGHNDLPWDRVYERVLLFFRDNIR